MFDFLLFGRGGVCVCFFFFLGGVVPVLFFVVWAGSCLIFLLLGQGTCFNFCRLGGGVLVFFAVWAWSGVHSFTGLPGWALRGLTTKKTKNKKTKSWSVGADVFP